MTSSSSQWNNERSSSPETLPSDIATLPLTDTKDLLSTECNCSHNGGGNSNHNNTSSSSTSAVASSAAIITTTSSSSSLSGCNNGCVTDVTATATTNSSILGNSSNSSSGGHTTTNGGGNSSSSVTYGAGVGVGGGGNNGLSNIRTTAVDHVDNHSSLFAHFDMLRHGGHHNNYSNTSYNRPISTPASGLINNANLSSAAGGATTNGQMSTSTSMYSHHILDNSSSDLRGGGGVDIYHGGGCGGVGSSSIINSSSGTTNVGGVGVGGHHHGSSVGGGGVVISGTHYHHHHHHHHRHHSQDSYTSASPSSSSALSSYLHTNNSSGSNSVVGGGGVGIGGHLHSSSSSSSILSSSNANTSLVSTNVCHTSNLNSNSFTYSSSPSPSFSPSSSTYTNNHNHNVMSTVMSAPICSNSASPSSYNSTTTSHFYNNLLRNNGSNYLNSNTTSDVVASTSSANSSSNYSSSASTNDPQASTTAALTTTTTTNNISNNSHHNCDYRHESNQNGLEDSPRRHSSMDQLLGLLNEMGKSSRTRSLSDGGTQEDDDELDKEAQPDLLNNTPPVPPKRSHRRRHTPPRPISNGLPPTPKVHMGACFSKIFNGCPLRVHCTASWIHPETRDQHLLIGAEEGIFNLNMNELHDAAIDQLFPRRTTWLYVIKDVLMSLSGKSCQLYRHDLIALHSKQTHRFSLHMNKIPERLVPRKFALTTKVPDTKGCTQCCVTRNPYNGYKYLCGATPNGIFLMQWYDPLNKFMLLKQCEWPATSILGGGHGCVQNGHTPVFEMIITPELEYPIVCTGVRKAANGCLKLELINMNSASWFHSDDLEYDAMATMVPRRDLLKVVKVHQVEKDAIIVCYGNIIQVVTLQGNPKQHKKLVSQLNFDFNVDSIVCLPDSVLAFHKHGMQGKSLRNGEITQEIKDMSRTYRLLGSDK
ncbi:serine-rich adhesin for platelets isoform X2 [Lucilia cuprina]|uniref:serine-rich adhesin for platelets isoform X2 n=1 Tax=Lucilia cuprina TaxID=7375 RepID=UPI001F05C9DA|nr:serine-rich adhesin for platelets isoform X2 [Lucilia cuprina]